MIIFYTSASDSLTLENMWLKIGIIPVSYFNELIITFMFSSEFSV